MNPMMDHPNSAPFILFGVFSLVLWWLLQESKVQKFLKTIPGPRCYPLIGAAIELRHTEEFLNKLEGYQKKYGNRVRVVLGTYNVLILYHPTDIEKILSSPALSAKAKLYDFFLPWLGLGVFISKGQKWRPRRKLYMPVFHLKTIQSFQTVFNEQAQVLVDIIKERVWKGETEIPMHGLFMKCTLDIITETAFGLKISSQQDPNSLYVDALAKEAEYVFERVVSPWLHSDFIFKHSPLGRKEEKNRELMEDFVDQIIKERKLLMEDSHDLNNISYDNENGFYGSTKKRPCLLDMLLLEQRNGNLSDVEIRDETSSFIFAGHDTTASNLIWTLFLVATNVDAQRQVTKELDAVLGADRERPISSEDLGSLRYLEACVKESLRLYPPAPIVGRSLEQDVKLDEDTMLPKGLEIIMSPWVTHRIPELYSEPLEFRPSRHFPENSKGRHPYSFLPFSAGPRNCIGMKFALAEDKIILANIFRNFHVELVDDPARIVVLPEIVIRPKGDIKFRLTLRK